MLADVLTVVQTSQKLLVGDLHFPSIVTKRGQDIDCGCAYIEDPMRSSGIDNSSLALAAQSHLQETRARAWTLSSSIGQKLH